METSIHIEDPGRIPVPEEAPNNNFRNTTTNSTSASNNVSKLTHNNNSLKNNTHHHQNENRKSHKRRVVLGNLIDSKRVLIPLKILIYLFSYPLLLILLLLSLVSTFYKVLVRLWLLLRCRRKDVRILSAEDACWVNEGTRSPSNIVINLKLQGRRDHPHPSYFYEEFKAKLTSILERDNRETYEKLGYIVSEQYGLYVLVKHSMGVDISDHFFHLRNVCVKTLMQNVLGTKLPGTKPQWIIYLVENEAEEGMSVHLIFVFHHAYGDGITWINLINRLTDQDGFHYFVNPFEPRVESSCFQTMRRNILTLLMTPHHFAYQLKDIWTERNPFHGEFAEGSKFLYEFDLDLSEIKRKCKGRGLSVTSWIRGRLRKGFKNQGVPHFGFLAISPYATLPYEGFKPVNQFYPCFDMMRTTETSSSPKDTPEVIKRCNSLISKVCGSLVSPLQKFMAFTSAHGTVAFSNVPSSRDKIQICSRTVEEFSFTPPIKFRTGIVLGLVGYCDRVKGTLVLDEYVVRRGFKADKFIRAFYEDEE